MVTRREHESNRFRHALAALAALAALLVVVAPLSSACTIGDPDNCTPSEFTDHCEGNVAVTCDEPFATGSGFSRSAKIHRADCGATTCGPTRECRQACDICEAKEVSVIGCSSPNPPPLHCTK